MGGRRELEASWSVPPLHLCLSPSVTELEGKPGLPLGPRHRFFSYSVHAAELSPFSYRLPLLALMALAPSEGIESASIASWKQRTKRKTRSSPLALVANLFNRGYDGGLDTKSCGPQHKRKARDSRKKLDSSAGVRTDVRSVSATALHNRYTQRRGLDTELRS
jgi:hypothetical protein